MEEQIRIKTTEINTKIQTEKEEQNQISMQEKMHPVMTDRNAIREKEAQPEDFLAQFQQAAGALQSDTSRSSDSFEMKAVKREVQKLQQMLPGADPEELLAQYSWMETVLRDKYLKPRQSDSSSYQERHRKVQTILSLLTEEKKKIQKSKDLNKADVLKIEHRNMTTLSDQICRSNKGAAGNRAALKKLLAKDVPMQEQKFTQEKGKILLAYDVLIASFQSVANSFCITERSKQNRLDAERVILQLQREKKLYQKATFEAFAKNHYRTWEEDLFFVEEKPALQLNREELTERKHLFVETNEEGQKADAATQMFFQLVGAPKLCRKTEKAKLDDGEDGQKDGLVIHKGNRLFTHEQAVARSRETKRNLAYSYEALRQLGTIQIIDMICGQKNRRPDSFVYKLREQEIDEETYLMIESVKVTDNTISFGTDSFEELNRDSGEEEGISTKMLVQEDGRLTIPTYDERVADTIISLDPALMRTYFLAAGLEEEKADALSARLVRMQEVLRYDKDHGRRAQSAQAPDQRSKEYAHQEFLYGNTHFLGSQDLLRDRGVVKEGPMKDINNTDMNKSLISNARSIAKEERIEAQINEDRRNKFGYQELNKDTKRILTLIHKYATSNKNREIHQAWWSQPLLEFLRDFNPKLLDTYEKKVEKDHIPEDQKNAEIERRLIAQFGNRDEMVNYAEEGPLEELRPKLAARIRTLTEREGDLSEQEQTELSKLQAYQTDIFGQCDGTLQIPANAKVRYVSDRTGFKADAKWRKKDNTPLFCHEPRISDLNQSEVGDCYFVSTLAAVVNREPDLIKQNMKDNGDGTVTVRFFKPALIGDPKPIYVKVDKSIAGGEDSYKHGLNGAMWAKLYEKAFIASGLVKNRWFTRYSAADLWGGKNADAAMYITGREAKQLFFINDSTSYKDYRDSNSRAARRFKEHVNRVKILLQNATDQHQIMTGGTFRKFQTETDTTERGEKKFRGLAAQHAYTILGLVQIDGKDYVQLRNPGGKEAMDLIVNETTGNVTYRDAKQRTGAFYLDIDTFARFFSQVYAINSPAT